MFGRHKKNADGGDERISVDATLEDAMKDVNRKTRVETVKMPVLDPDSSREREIISAFTVQYGSRNPETAQKVSAWLTNQFMEVSRGNLLVRAKAAALGFDPATIERARRSIDSSREKKTGSTSSRGSNDIAVHPSWRTASSRRRTIVSASTPSALA